MSDEKSKFGFSEEPSPFEGAEGRIPASMRDYAEAHGVDAKPIFDAGGVAALEAEFQRLFRERNSDACDDWQAYVSEYGTIAEQLGLMKPE